MSGGGDWLSRWRVRLGYPLAVLVLWFARPTLESIGWGAAIGTVGLLVRGLAAGHLQKHEELATAGPYGYTRNPLYLGSAILAVAFTVACRSWAAAILVVAYFSVFYAAVMRHEELELRKQYGAVFEQYAARVPLFFPAWKKAAESGASGRSFSWQQYARNREYQAAIGFVLVLVVLFLLRHWRGG